MGVGKTTIGRVLADLMDLEFFDSDREIEASTGADIPWIFDVEGESGFRIRETRMLDQLSSKQGIVLATGGGVVLAEENRLQLKNRGVVVYLRASINHQIERTSRDKNRPMPPPGRQERGGDAFARIGLDQFLVHEETEGFATVEPAFDAASARFIAHGETALDRSVPPGGRSGPW